MGSLMKPQALDMTGHVRARAYSKFREMVEGFSNKTRNNVRRTDAVAGVDVLLFLLFRIVRGACVTQRAFASSLVFGPPGPTLRRWFFCLQTLICLPFIPLHYPTLPPPRPL